MGTPKAHKQRSVPLPEFLLPYLAASARGGTATICCSPARMAGTSNDRTPGRVVRQSRRRIWRAAGDAARPAAHRGQPGGVGGANVKAVQRMLGHASAAMTLDIYADLFDDDLEAVATALHEARSRENVAKMWADGQHKTPLATTENGF